MTQADKFEAFKALHNRPGTFVIPNPWDAGTARILTALGFEALATTSAGFAFSIGCRDSAAQLSRDAVLDNARSIVEATHLPVSADLEYGFGSEPEECARTIEMAASIGMVGGSIEDATGDPRDPIFDFNASVERIAAACEAAGDLPFIVTARAENYLWDLPDLDDTIKRLQAYSEVGTDVLYAPGLPDLDAIRTVCEAVDKPVNVVMGLRQPVFTVDELRAAGVKRISVGGAFARAALGAFVRAAMEVKEKGSFTFSVEAIPDATISDYMEDRKRS